jgi:mannitol-1-phosphate 5-dehydrogenase
VRTALKQAIIFGAGNIGRGFIGQLFSESGYHVTFADIDATLLEALNGRGRYTIRLVTNERTEAVEVGPVAALHSADAETVADVVARAEIGATAVGAGILKRVAPVVARGLARRAEIGNRNPLNLILCENLHGAAAIFRGMVLSHLPESLHPFVAERIGFVDTVIARMVPPLTPELRAEDPSLILVEPYKDLPVDKDAFVGPIPVVVGMIPYAPFGFFTERKLYIHNAGHATLGYLGYLKGYEYGYEALADDEIYFQARGAMEESALALTRKFHPPQGALLANIDDLLHRFGNRALGDTILRLGRDTLRKLAPGDRLAGAAVNCLEQGVTPVNIITGLAAGLRFDHPADPVAQELQARIKANGLHEALPQTTGIPAESRLGAMILERYKEIQRR